MASSPKLSLSCHCGAAKQVVRLRHQSTDTPQDINLCHCTACRHNTGVLCVSYAGIEPPDSIEGLAAYRSSTKTITRFFCATCGCHVFWRLRSSPEEDSRAEVGGGVRRIPDEEEWWAVATGVIIGPCDDDIEESGGERGEVLMRYAKHINTAGTEDGGLSLFIPHIGRSEETQDPLPSISAASAQEASPQSDLKEERGRDVLDAVCHCRAVRFHVTRPNAASRLPRSNYPDLMLPYHTNSTQIQNPNDDKWWIRSGFSHGGDVKTEGTPAENNELSRYLAGTCACRSCRLTSGFEIQTWAFIPRANIFFHIRDNQSGSSASEPPMSQSPGEVREATDIVPLDFKTLPPNILTSYQSSEGVRREFCSNCGATVFWRDRWRPELIDVSVGLLDAAEGARAVTWLDWWTERVSFSEDAANGRKGETARRAQFLIGCLEEGLRSQSIR